MLKRNKKTLVIGVILAIIISFFTFGTPRYQAIKINNINFGEFKNRLKGVISTSTEIDINKLTNFEWDECYVFDPYYPPEAIYEKVGVEWTTTKTFMGFLLFHDAENQTVNDDQYLIVFKKDNKVILSEKYSLSELPVIFKLDNYKVTSENSEFRLIDSKQYDNGKIIELVLKN